jgi:hypothetical protein
MNKNTKYKELGLPKPETSSKEGEFRAQEKKPEEAVEGALIEALQASQEHIQSPETKEKKDATLPEPRQAEVAPPQQQVTASQVRQMPDQQLKKIETILSEGLADEYAKMPDALKRKFKEEGEQAASKIQSLFRKGKATAQKIAKIITKWLKMVPGINAFFLEQEAKIKADRLMHEAAQEEDITI